MYIISQSGLSKVVGAAFAVQLAILILQMLPLPEPVMWAVRLIILSFFFWGINKCVKIEAMDIFGRIFTYLFIAWLFVEFVIAAFYSEGYWMWKRIIINLLNTLFYSIIILSTNIFFVQGIYRLFWRYCVYLLLFAYVVFHNVNMLNYLPYTTLLLFLGAIPPKKRWPLLIIVGILFVAQFQRNDLVKMIVAGLIGFSISFGYQYISKTLIKIVCGLLLILPFLFLYLGIIGPFNIFKLNEYLGDDHKSTYTNSKGEVVEEDLTADTRTFIYENVFYTMNKYNAWIMGRSPAYGDEGLIGAASQMNEYSKLEGRYGNEVGIMNMLLWYGIIGCVLFYLLYIRAAYLALFKSNNKYMEAVAIYVSFLWCWSFVWEVAVFETFFMMNIMMLGICFSRSFRAMNNAQFERWVLGIFAKKSDPVVVLPK